MARFHGSNAADIIHRMDDGVVSGGNEVTGVTARADQISGDVGNDVVFGDACNETINGNDGSDTLVGRQGADRVGNDAFRILQQSDISGLAETLNGGNHFDKLDFQTFQVIGAVNLSVCTIVIVEQLLFSASISV